MKISLPKGKLCQHEKNMAKFNYDISIEAPTEQESDTKMSALTVLASRLTAKELEKLAHIVKNDPVKLSLAKKALGV
ncbi:MAG: hypothetical protein AB7O73_03335 [Bacteroidia bacterium]